MLCSVRRYFEDVGAGLFGVFCDYLDVVVEDREGLDPVVVDVEFLAE